MTIRDMTSNDLSRVLEINKAHVPEVGPIDADRLRFLVAESAFSLVVESPGEASQGGEPGDAQRDVVGFCVVFAPGSSYDSINYQWFMDRYDDAYYLDRVAFDTAVQRSGLGSALYAEVGRRLHDLGASWALEVNIDPPNEPSLAFHRKHGFVEVGRQTSKGIEVSMMHRPAS